MCRHNSEMMQLELNKSNSKDSSHTSQIHQARPVFIFQTKLLLRSKPHPTGLMLLHSDFQSLALSKQMMKCRSQHQQHHCHQQQGHHLGQILKFIQQGQSPKIK